MTWLDGDPTVQRSAAWLEARKHRLGGSEIASVLGISPYKTRRQLFEEKIGLRVAADISNLPHVKRGIDAEAIICEKVEALLRVKYSQPVLVHPMYPHFACSLDGYCDDHIAEFKTMGAKKHSDVAASIVPDYYRVQMQWGMMISGKPKCLFASYRPEDQSLHMCWERSSSEWQAQLLDAAIAFWACVERKELPEMELGL